MPMRTPLTPALPTGILFCELAMTVPGNSTRTRAGEFSLLTLGVTALLELISMRVSSAVSTTFTRWSWLCWPGAEEGFAAAGAAFAARMVAGFTAGAGEPGTGFEFCAQTAPAIIVIARMPVVSFIAILFLRPRLGR